MPLLLFGGQSGAPGIARDAELGKVVGWHPEICCERGRAAGEERSRSSLARGVAVGGRRKSGQIAREAMQPRKKYGDLNIGRP